MKQRAKRTNQKHPGVRLMHLQPDVEKSMPARWVARWTDSKGKLRQAALERLGIHNATGRRRWAQAKSKELAEIRRGVSLGTVEASPTTVVKAVADYLELQANAATKKNKQIVLDAFSLWCDECGVKSTMDISPLRLTRWRDRILSPKTSDHEASTRNRWLIATGIFLRWLSEKGLLPLVTWDVIRRACKRAKEPKKAIEFLRPHELRQLLEAAIAHDKGGHVEWKVAPFVLALLLSGMRFDELCGLDWQEVDLAAGEIRLPAERTKTSTARTVSLRESPQLLALLRALRERCDGVGRVFPGLRHPVWEAARVRLIDEYKAPRFSAHWLRRSCGTLLTNAPAIYGGASAWHSAKRLGHSVQQAEAHYAGQLRDLPADAKTIEAAGGFEDIAARIVAGVK